MEELTQGPTMFQIFAKLLDGKTTVLRFTTRSVSGQDIKGRISDITRIPHHSQRLICGGIQLRDHSIVSTPECTVHVALRLVGGKGGFGSLLRGAGTKAGQKKTNNFDACRDMSGRRLRHVNAEKRLEEWKAEEDERRLEKMAEEFIKKKAKKGKKGVGDGEAQKYVEMYREESAKCTKEVEEAVREACGIGKRKKKAELDGVDAKRLKIWMGKRELGGSDSEDMDEDSGDDDKGENEKSVLLNDGNHSDSSKEANGSSDSVTGGKHNGELLYDTSSMSGSEEERGPHMEQKLNGSTFEEIVRNEEVKPEIPAETVALSSIENPESELSRAEKQDNAGTEDLTISKNGDVTVNEPDANGLSQSKSELNEEAVLPSLDNCDGEKPLDFNESSSAADLEVLGLERLKIELQNRGLKCGGSLQERAARLFLLKSTPLEKLPKKLFAKK